MIVLLDEQRVFSVAASVHGVSLDLQVRLVYGYQAFRYRMLLGLQRVRTP